MGLLHAKESMMICFYTILERDRQMDRQNYYISIMPQHCCADAR